MKSELGADPPDSWAQYGLAPTGPHQYRAKQRMH